MRLLVLSAGVLWLALPEHGAAQARDSLPYRDSRLSVEARVRDLLGRMTPEEKFWQLFMIPGDLDTPSHDYTKGIFGLQISTAHDSAATPPLSRPPC